MNNKNVYIIAGPNGSGKTTFAMKFLPEYAKCQHFVNADLIALGLSPFSPQQAAIKAGKLVLEQIHELVNNAGIEPKLIAKKNNRDMDIIDKFLFDKILNKLGVII